MTPVLRFFDDYGSGWLWAGNDETRAALGVGPLDGQFATRLSPDTLALAAHLLERSAASLNPDYPPDGCPWRLGARWAFDLAADALLARMRAELGKGVQIEDHRNRLAP